MAKQNGRRTMRLATLQNTSTSHHTSRSKTKFNSLLLLLIGAILLQVCLTIHYSTSADLWRSIGIADDAPVQLLADNKLKKKSSLQTSACIEGQDVLDFVKDGSSYNCLKNNDTRSSNSSHYYKYEGRHYELPKTDILLLDKPIGNVIRICEMHKTTLLAKDEHGVPELSTTMAMTNLSTRLYQGEGENRQHVTATNYRRCVLPIGEKTSNINSPMPVHTKGWMADRQPFFRGTSLIVYYSSHIDDAIAILALDSTTGLWKNIQRELEFEPPEVCWSLHSPSVFVDEDEKRFYM